MIGEGLHLSPLFIFAISVLSWKYSSFACISASYCDVDENGVQHMVLCRVILGNTELLLPGSQQWHPSEEIYDNGVDDLKNPSHYIIWNMNLNTHIYPVYVISFRVPPGVKGISCVPLCCFLQFNLQVHMRIK